MSLLRSSFSCLVRSLRMPIVTLSKSMSSAALGAWGTGAFCCWPWCGARAKSCMVLAFLVFVCPRGPLPSARKTVSDRSAGTPSASPPGRPAPLVPPSICRTAPNGRPSSARQVGESRYVMRPADSPPSPQARRVRAGPPSTYLPLRPAVSRPAPSARWRSGTAGQRLNGATTPRRSTCAPARPAGPCRSPSGGTSRRSGPGPGPCSPPVRHGTSPSPLRP